MWTKYLLPGIPLLLMALGASACEPGESKAKQLAATSMTEEATGETKSAGVDIDALVAECAECHSGRMGFSGEAPEDLAVAIKSLEGEDHEGIPALSEEDLMKLAAELAK